MDRVHGRQLSLFSKRKLPPAVLRGMYFVICREQIDISNVILWVNLLVRHCTKSARTSYLATVLALFTSSTNHSRSHKRPNIRMLTLLVAQDRNVDMQGGVTRVTLKFCSKFRIFRHFCQFI